jgi:hypothetical protein
LAHKQGAGQSSLPTNSLVRYGPRVSDAKYFQINNQLISNHEIFISRPPIDSGWVYQVQGTNGDSERVYSEWRVIMPNAITSVSSTASVSTEYNLLQNYPNPFNPSTTIKFSVPKSGFVRLTIFDVLGKEIAVLVNEHLPEGDYTIVWDALGHPSGTYYYRINANEYIGTKKLILLK